MRPRRISEFRVMFYLPTLIMILIQMNRFFDHEKPEVSMLAGLNKANLVYRLHEGPEAA